MKKAILATLLLVLVSIGVTAVDVDTEFGIVVTPEEFAPRVFFGMDRIVTDDYTEPGAISDGGEDMVEREHNYAFEGEQIEWDILVWDKNGDDKISDVYVSVQMQNETGVWGDFIEVNCVHSTDKDALELDFLAGMIYEGEEVITWNADTMNWYLCLFTVETPTSMHGEHWITAVAEDNSASRDMTVVCPMDEHLMERWSTIID